MMSELETFVKKHVRITRQKWLRINRVESLTSEGVNLGKKETFFKYSNKVSNKKF